MRSQLSCCCFFQAEDGIRGGHVTGVQTCALPICWLMGVLSSSPSDMDQCIEECLRCARACEECHTACLQEPDVQARITCMQHLNDCAEICFQAVALMARNSQSAKNFCNLCAAMCEACATECDKFQDTHCKECANICRSCAEVCRQMAS